MKTPLTLLVRGLDFMVARRERRDDSTCCEERDGAASCCEEPVEVAPCELTLKVGCCVGKVQVFC